MNRSYRVVVVALLFVTAIACERPETVDDPVVTEVPDPVAEEVGDIGDVDFETSCSDEAQEHFEAGLGLVHHMWYVKAREAFQEVLLVDPNCAMGYWGLAMTYYTPLWAPPTDEALEAGAMAAERAQQLEATEREQAFVDAVSAFYEDYENVSHAERAEAFRDGWEEAHERDPDDVEAASFYALGILATAPTITETYEDQIRAGEILEGVLEQQPRHPAGHHYLLHAYDFPPLADRALEVAQNYADIAPAVPHALHMPSHIFVRLGMWEDNNEWNLRSADAAEEHPVNGMTSMHFYHALDYVVYGYLQQGLDDRAADVAERSAEAENPQPHMGTAYSSAAIPARIALEQRNWEDATEVAPQHVDDIPWDDYPAAQAVVHTTRAVGAVFAGEMDTADEEFERLEQVNEIVAELDDPHWTPHVQAQHDIAEALITYNRGETEEGIEMMREATEFQDSFDKHPIMPGRVVEAGEYLGVMLFDDGQYVQALEAYEQALEMTPNRYHLFYGAAVSARQANQPEVASRYYRELIELADPDQVDRPEVEEAVEYLERVEVRR